MKISYSSVPTRRPDDIKAQPEARSAQQPTGESVPKDGYQSSEDKYWVMAGEAMVENDIQLSEHSLMRENLATYFAHSTRSIPSARWENKIERELGNPYTDQQVYQHIETLEDSLQANLSELPAYPSQVFITGSFAKGRLGANSDLDGFAVVADENMSAGFDSYEKREKDPTGANLFPLSEESPGYTKGHLMFAGQSVELTSQQALKDGILTEIYDEIRAGRSIDRIETSQSFEWVTSKLWGEDKTAKEKREAFENKSFKTRIQNGIMSLGGTLSDTPLVGPVVNFVTDKFATQKHLDFTDKR